MNTDPRTQPLQLRRHFIAERLRRRPPKPMGSPRVGSDPRCRHYKQQKTSFGQRVTRDHTVIVVAGDVDLTQCEGDYEGRQLVFAQHICWRNDTLAE